MTRKFNVGDKVLLINRGGWGPVTSYQTDIVAKVHKGNGNVTLEATGEKFRQNGSEVGGSHYSSQMIEPFSEELAAGIDAAKEAQTKRLLLNSLGDRLLRMRDDEEAARIWDAIPAEVRSLIADDGQ